RDLFFIEFIEAIFAATASVVERDYAGPSVFAVSNSQRSGGVPAWRRPRRFAALQAGRMTTASLLNAAVEEA
ncbi:MAG: hypothetical protein VX496_02530, partial [Planctomycetota bacterium]|nr:hypothetical protein [Planctomycetota bacterium]